MKSRPIFEVNNNINQTEYYWYQNGFSEEELEWITNLQAMYQYDTASIVGSTNPSDDISNIRNSRIKWLTLDDNSSWVYEKLANMCLEANDTIWGFNVTSLKDDVQYTEYYEGGGHYDWHVDIGPYPINHRKISIVVQLSDPSEYEGGDLELWTGGQFKQIPKIKGCTVVFPSFLLHRVTPVTKGIRKSLVLWVGGDAYQ